MPDEMTPGEAAEALGTSTQTIRNLLGDGSLTGRRGPRNWWLVDRASVTAFLQTRGRLNGNRRRKSRAATLQAEIERLRSEVDRLASVTNTSGSGALAALKERDDLRAQVVALEDSLAQMREAADLQRHAEAERSELVQHLLGAVASADRADTLRRQATEALEAGLARATLPGHLD
jgi:excisionase family DNA binding protein